MNRKIAAVISETTEARTVKRRAVPVVVHVLLGVYRLECGHTITRTRARNREAPAVGGKLKCHACSAPESVDAHA